MKRSPNTSVSRGIVTRSIASALLFTTLVTTAPGQSKINTGELAGRVLDETGAVIPGAQVEMKDLGKGAARSVVADGQGRYRIPLLAPGSYRLTFSAPSFFSQVLELVSIRVGDTTVVDGVLTVEAPTFQVEVTARIPVIDLERTQQSTFVSAVDISMLPINRRNYLDFALLSPGVVETTDLADEADFRIPSTPQSGLGFAGSDGRGNAFAIDGMEVNGATGNVRPTLAQVAIQEFQVNRNSYSAEYGGGYGGAINIVSRSGSNDFHGNAFGFLRHRSIQARNFFDPEKSAFTRVQSGASIGGPLRKDRTFFFAAVERLDRHESAFVPILQDRSVLNRITTSQDEVFSFFEQSGDPRLEALGPILRQVLTPSANPSVAPLFETNSGVFPFASDRTQASLRVDHRTSDRHEMFFRLSATDETQENTAFGALSGFNRGSYLQVSDISGAFQDAWFFNPRWIGTSRLNFAYNRYRVSPNDPFGPALDVGGFGHFGQDIQLPSDEQDHRLQFQQLFNYSSGRHALKFGVDFNPTRVSSNPQVFFGGRFIFGEFLPLGLILNAVTADPSFSNELVATYPELGPSVAEPINSLQAFSLGLPVVYIQAFGNPVLTGWQKRFASFIEDTFQPTSNLTLTLGLRHQFEADIDLPTLNRFAPRLGFAWRPGGRRDLVLRGGYGIFHSTLDFQASYSATGLQRPDLNVIFIPLSGAAGIINPSSGLPLNSADIYQTLTAQGIIGNRRIEFSDLTQFGIGPEFRFPVTGSVAEDVTNPYSQQASLELEKSFASLALSAGYNFSRTLHLPRTRDVNLFEAGRRPDGFPVFGRIDPTVANNFVMEFGSNAYYNALVLQANKQFSGGWGINAHYTWSKAIDERTDFHQDYIAHDQTNQRGDRGLSSFHREHRFVLRGVLESPIKESGSAWQKVLKDWTLSAIVQAASFQPFNVLTGFDNLGDGQVNTHRPLGLGRNTGIGPDSFTADLRLVRTWAIAKSETQLQLSAEVFNLLNRTNFRSVNNVVGNVTVADLPSPLLPRHGSPTTPLAYTSAYDPRQFKFGIEIIF